MLLATRDRMLLYDHNSFRHAFTMLSILPTLHLLFQVLLIKVVVFKVAIGDVLCCVVVVVVSVVMVLVMMVVEG